VGQPETCGCLVHAVRGIACDDAQGGDLDVGERGGGVPGHPLVLPLGFARTAPLSVLALELLPQDVPPADPLGAQLGGQRILRNSALTPVPVIC
jgi:hypothetical protein